MSSWRGLAVIKTDCVGSFKPFASNMALLSPAQAGATNSVKLP